MRRYETVVIVDPDLPEDDRTALFTRIKEIIPQQNGVFLQADLWGVKKLAYDIKKKPRGYYARFDYCGVGPVVDELERFFRIDERVMKYLTVQLNPEADVEKIKAQLEAAQAQANSQTPVVEAAPSTTENSPAQEDLATDRAEDGENTFPESQKE